MTILRDISLVYASFFSLVMLIILFESRYPKKKTMRLTLFLMVPLLLVNFVMLFILGPKKMSTLLLLTCSLPSLVFFLVLAKHRDGRFFFTFCLADTLVLEIMHMTTVLDFFLGNTYIFMFAARLILYPLLAWAMFKWVRPFYLDLQNQVRKGWYIFTAIALLFYVVLSMFISIPTMITQRPEQLPIFILLLILLPTIYIHIFSTLRHQQQLYQTTDRENILQVQMASMRSRIDEFAAANELLREERHNFRHGMRTVATLAGNGQYEELKAMAQEYADALPEKPVESYCRHAVLDAVLASYLGQAKRKGIRVVTKINFPDPLPTNESELATVFANAIENAIYACEQIEPEKRYIEVTVLTQPCFMLQVKNSFNGLIAFDEDGIPISPKKGHGFGTRSVVTFCERNNTFYEFKTKDKDFFLKIVFR